MEGKEWLLAAVVESLVQLGDFILQRLNLSLRIDLGRVARDKLCLQLADHFFEAEHLNPQHFDLIGRRMPFDGRPFHADLRDSLRVPDRGRID